MDPTLFVLCLGLLVCLLPLAVYCLALAFVNNRARPTLVRGDWDFAYALAGLSGFVLLGGPVLLAAADAAWHAAWVRGDLGAIRQLLAGGGGPRATLWGAYLVLVVGGTIVALLSRRRVTVVYGLDAPTLPTLLAGALAEAGRTVTPTPTGVRVGPGDNSPPVEIEVESFAATRNLTLRWGDTPPAERRRLETALARECDRVETPGDASAANYLLTAAGCLFLMSLFSLMFLASIVFFPRR